MDSKQDPSKPGAFDELNKIQRNDINSFVIADDIEDLKNRNKKYVW